MPNSMLLNMPKMIPTRITSNNAAAKRSQKPTRGSVAADSTGGSVRAVAVAAVSLCTGGTAGA